MPLDPETDDLDPIAPGEFGDDDADDEAETFAHYETEGDGDDAVYLSDGSRWQ